MPMDDFENDLTQLLHRIGEEFRMDNQALVPAGLARGRTLRRRRMAGITGGVAALALVGVGSTLLPGMLHPQDTKISSAGGPVTSIAHSTKPGEVSKEDMIRLLTGLLPKGKVSGATGRGTELDGERPSSSPYAQVVFDDGPGPASISVNVSRLPSSMIPDWTSCPGKISNPYDQCTRRVLVDGAVLVVNKGYERANKPDGTKWWSAVLTAKDGRQVAVSEYNAPTEKDSATTRPEPPLTAPQLAAVATSDVWNRVLAAIPAPAPAPTGGSGQSKDPSSKQILTTFRELLPKNLKTADESGHNDGGYAALTVDDGRGKSAVGINVDHPRLSAEELAGWEKQPDGTLLSVSQQPSEKGGKDAVQWSVATLYPDGTRVAIIELNAASWGVDATRKTPVFTIDQLKAFATSTAWRK
ncbi:hypothetical protein ACIQFZ_42515 [Streptomyces sp. NPDC093064]|uniref:hypothetical protein n=1 Tax=Streptomyces sp. NPDC093064 TaxID=3366020 RepID=UPI0037F15B00